MYKRYCIYIAILFILSACTQLLELIIPSSESNIVLYSDDSIIFDSEGGEYEIIFFVSGEYSINVSDVSSEWCKVGNVTESNGRKQLTVYVENNESYDERNAYVSIRSGKESKVITVTQKQKDAILISSNKVEAKSTEAIYELSIRHNIDFSFEIEEKAKDWLEIVQTKGTGMSVSKLQIHVDENTSLERRQGCIYLFTKDGLQEIIDVYQEGAEETIVLTTQNEMTIGSEGGQLKIEIRSNVEVTLDYPDFEWIHLIESKAFNAFTYYFQIDPNETYEERNVAITFKGVREQEIVTIIQKQKDALLLSSNKIEVGASGGEVTIEIVSNQAYEIQSDPFINWFSVVQINNTKKLTTSSIKLIIKPNEGLDSRRAKFKVIAGDLQEEVDVYQMGAEPVLVLSENELLVNSSGGIVKVEVKSNSDYKYEIKQDENDIDNWIEPYGDARSMSSYTHKFKIKPNNEYTTRQAQVVFTNLEDYKQYTVTIIQSQKNAILLSENEYYIDSRSQRLSFKVQTNVDFNLDITSDWIILAESIPTRTLENREIHFDVLENHSRHSRNAIITLSYEDVIQEISIFQKEASNVIRLDVIHNCQFLNVPLFIGDYVYGDVYWGDGNIDDYSKRLSHTFEYEGNVTTSFNIYGADSFIIEKITNISSIVLYTDHSSIGSVEDVIIDRIEWD